MTGTRSQSKEDVAPTCHILNYFYDNENGFALTTLVHTFRFHIMVDYDRIKSKEVQKEYLGLLKAVQGKEEPQEKRTSPSKKRKRGSDDEQDSGYGSSPPSGQGSEGKRSSESSVTLAEDDREDNEAVRDLQNWILEAFGDIFASRAPSSEERKPKTVHEWFHGDVFYYTLTSDEEGTLQPEEEDKTSELEQRITELIPGLDLPKYLTSLDMPIFTTSDLSIDSTSDSPSPLHPAIVTSSTTSDTYFLKLVDPSQPGPTKRELKLMKDIETKNLHSKIRVPLVCGVVVDSSSSSPDKKHTKRDEKCTILGFLMTHIPNATPLTTTLDSDMAETKRERWAKDAEHFVSVLHDNGIVWGDAKADNYMVDEKGELWIIDFGGSYTEGWIEPELSETVEGDLMGVGKVVGAVRDPEGGREGEEEEEDEREGKRRKVDEGENEGEEEEVRRLQHEEEEEEEGAEDLIEDSEESKEEYCYCRRPDEGRMIACDGPDCKVEWFHVKCTGLKDVPAEDEKWYCDECKE